MSLGDGRYTKRDVDNMCEAARTDARRAERADAVAFVRSAVSALPADVVLTTLALALTQGLHVGARHDEQAREKETA